MKIVEFPTPPAEGEQHVRGVVASLEEMLKWAREGRLHHIVAIGVDPRTNRTYRVRYNELNIALIGAVSVTLVEMQADYSLGAACPLPSPEVS